jgi:pilus assembly protein FimV
LLAVAFVPIALAFNPTALAERPSAIAFVPLAAAVAPIANELLPWAAAPCPMATVGPFKAVDSDDTLLFVVLKPVELDVDSEVNWPKFTASVGFAPAATLVRVTGAVEPTPPNVTFL